MVPCVETRAWRAHSEMKRPCCSCRGQEFDSQLPHQVIHRRHLQGPDTFLLLASSQHVHTWTQTHAGVYTRIKIKESRGRILPVWMVETVGAGELCPASLPLTSSGRKQSLAPPRAGSRHPYRRAGLARDSYPTTRKVEAGRLGTKGQLCVPWSLRPAWAT